MKLLFVFVLVACALAFDVDLYDHADYHNHGHGSHYTAHMNSQCFNLPHSFQHRATSVNAHGHCVKLCSRENCHGDCITLTLIGGCHPHSNLANCGFNDRTVSIQKC